MAGVHTGKGKNAVFAILLWLAGERFFAALFCVTEFAIVYHADFAVLLEAN